MERELEIASFLNSLFETLITISYSILQTRNQIEHFEKQNPQVSENKVKSLQTIINKVWKTYAKDGIFEIIIQVKLNTLQQVPYNIRKKYFKLEIEDSGVLNDWLYIKSGLYVSINMDNILYTKTLKKYRLCY